MADLIVIAFDTESEAAGAYADVLQLNEDLVVELAGLALVTVDDHGKTHVQTPNREGSVGYGVAGGALFGVLLGILFFVPIFGLVMGGALGALFAGLDKTGINREFRDRVKQAVKSGKSAVVIYSRKITEDKFAAALEGFHGTIVQTSLSSEEEKNLAHDLTGADN